MIAAIESVADLLESLGNVPANRVRMVPTPGTATEVDVEAALRGPGGRLCELIDGTLVEKAVGFRESRLTVFLARVIDTFVTNHNLGIVTEHHGMVWLTASRLRGPDLAFTSWKRFPGRKAPDVAYLDIPPDFVIEVLSKSNTPEEMSLKRQDYFGAGTALVWEVDPKRRVVEVYTTAAAADALLTDADIIDGQPVLPGFSLRLADLFAELDRHG